MQVFASINSPSDQPFWITRMDFAGYFDQYDFVDQRDIVEVTPAYRKDWFYKSKNRLEFIIPVVGWYGAKSQFINGRHRTAVLLKYMPEVPIALASHFLTTDQLRLRSAIPKRALDPTIPFELPDLPFLTNSGKLLEY